MKFCPNCGEQLDQATRFCTNCGFDTQMASQGQTKSEQPTTNGEHQQPAKPETSRSTNEADSNDAKSMIDIQQFSSGYVAWLRTSLKQPNQVVTGEKYYGLISLVLHALLVTIAIVITVNKAINSAAGIVRSFLPISNVPNLSFGYDVKLLIAVLLACLVYVGVGVVSVKYLDNTAKVGFLGFTTRFAHLTNSVLILDVILILFALIFDGDSFSAVILPLIVIILTITIWSVGYVVCVRQSIKTFRFDPFYVLLTACAAVAVIYFFFICIEFSVLAADLASEASRSVSQFGNLFN